VLRVDAETRYKGTCEDLFVIGKHKVSLYGVPPFDFQIRMLVRIGLRALDCKNCRTSLLNLAS
jgi:hypothetical protein